MSNASEKKELFKFIVGFGKTLCINRESNRAIFNLIPVHMIYL